MTRYLQHLGGDIVAGWMVQDVEELPAAQAYLFDVTPRQLLRLGGRRLPLGYRRALRRYQYGPGSFKLDWALSDPIPWRDDACANAADNTVFPTPPLPQTAMITGFFFIRSASG